MSQLLENTQLAVASPSRAIADILSRSLIVGAILLISACSATDPATVALNIDPVRGQAVFTTPKDAAKAFTLAIENRDEELLGRVLGADYGEVLPLDTTDREDVDRYVTAWDKHHALLPQGKNKMLLAIGEGEWTLPIPIVSGPAGWYFDVDEGLERIRIRRIGRNELATMQAILAYYDAQMEYAEQDRNGDGLLEYARRLISTPGTHDGLYWETAPGETPSPAGPRIADLTPGGGYHGYHYRILDGQGEHARGGAYSYVIGDRMRAGFAAIAWPADYGETGVMSFVVSHDGIVYEHNLGEEGAEIAEDLDVYDPGPGWAPAKEVNGPPEATE